MLRLEKVYRAQRICSKGSLRHAVYEGSTLVQGKLSLLGSGCARVGKAYLRSGARRAKATRSFLIHGYERIG